MSSPLHTYPCLLIVEVKVKIYILETTEFNAAFVLTISINPPVITLCLDQIIKLYVEDFIFLQHLPTHMLLFNVILIVLSSSGRGYVSFLELRETLVTTSRVWEK